MAVFFHFFFNRGNMKSAPSKKSFFSVLFFSLFSYLFALPGVTKKIPDLSGQFVYYEDKSFERESYFGIIFYDEGTYGLRYFAPSKTDVKPLLPKKDIQILFSLDITKKYVELTGERIISAITPEDTDIINYLHDMLYELTARLQKASPNGFIEDKITVPQEFEQFGGEVKVNFDPLIPIFNVKSIEDSTGKIVFNLVTAGQLSSSSDENFSAFEGLPVKTEDQHSFSLNKKAEKQKITYKKTSGFTQKITLDSQWTAKAENFYTLSNSAILAFDVIDLSKTDSAQKANVSNTLLQKFTLGTDGTYPYSQLQKLETSASGTKVSNLFFNDISKSFTRDFKILTQLDENHLAIMSLTVFQGVYSKNSKYFDSILKSYSAK